MIHRAVLALADDGRAGQNDRQHRDVVDDPHDAGEPGRRDIGVEGDPDVEIDRLGCRRASERDRKLSISRRYDLLGVAGAEPRLHHRGGVDVELDAGRRVPQQVALEVGRDVDHEGVACRCSSAARSSRSAIGRGGWK